MDRDSALQLLSKPTDAPDSSGVATNAPAVNQDSTNAQAQTEPKTLQPVRTNTVAPRTDAALQNLVRGTQKGPLREAEEKRESQYIKETQIEGVPLDVESGASPWEKFVMGFHRERENQIKYLQNKYGENNVRTDGSGGLIVRVLDSDTGKPKDLKIDEWNMKAKDLLEVAGSVPEIAAGVIATIKGRSLPKVGALKGIFSMQRDIAAMAGGSEAAGAVKDVASSVAVKGPAGVEDVPKIAQERAVKAAEDVAIGEASMGIGRAINFFKSPLAGSRGPVQFDAIAAQKYFKEKYGVSVPLSIGESTGSPLLSRTEAFMEKLPGGGTPFQHLKGEQEEALRQLQNIMMGKVPSTDEAVGKATIDQLMKKIAPVEADVAQSSKTLGKVGTQQIENIVAGVTQPERQVFQSETGKDIRKAVIAKRDAAKAEADQLYAAVREAPGGEGKVFDASGLKDRFQEILKSLPAPEQTTTTPSSILGPTGDPILMTDTGEKVLKEFVPPNILARLNSVASLEDARFSLSDLQQMRREVYDDIAKGEGVPGLGTHYLNDIGKAITAAIDDGINQLPEGGLRDALNAANKHYKEKVVPFNRVGITELFRNPDEPGYVTDSEVINRVFSGGKAVQRYSLMKETLGESSPEFSKLKRSLADRVIEDSRLPGDTIIDPKKLVQNLTKLRTDTPEIARNMFGGKINEMFRQAKFLEYAKGSKVDAAELQSLMRDKSPTASSFKALIDAEKKRDELYRNEILKDVADGTIGSKPLNPSEFVNRFLDDAKPSDIKSVMYMVRANKPLVEDLRAKTVEKIFRDASRAATPGDIGKLMTGDPTRIVSGTSVFKQIESPATREKIKTVLGPEGFRDLENYIRIEAAGEAKETSFKAAGGLAAGMQIANLTRRGPLRYLYEAGKDWVVANLLTREPLRAWLSSVPASTDPGAVSLILTSPPFLEAVAKEFPGAKGSMFVSAIKGSVDKWMKLKSEAQGVREPMGQPQSPDEKRKAAEDLLTRGMEQKQ